MTLLLVWIGLVVLIYSVRSVLIHSYFKVNRDADAVRRWTYFYLSATALAGLAWGGIGTMVAYSEVSLRMGSVCDGKKQGSQMDFHLGRPLLQVFF